jgi:hypothetical protein
MKVTIDLPDELIERTKIAAVLSFVEEDRAWILEKIGVYKLFNSTGIARNNSMFSSSSSL